MTMGPTLLLGASMHFTQKAIDTKEIVTCHSTSCMQRDDLLLYAAVMGVQSG